MNRLMCIEEIYHQDFHYEIITIYFMNYFNYSYWTHISCNASTILCNQIISRIQAISLEVYLSQSSIHSKSTYIFLDRLIFYLQFITSQRVCVIYSKSKYYQRLLQAGVSCNVSDIFFGHYFLNVCKKFFGFHNSMSFKWLKNMTFGAHGKCEQKY